MTQPTNMKTTQVTLSRRKSFLFASVMVALLTGCHRSYQDSELVGSWLLATNRIKQTYTFSADHRLTIQTESTKNLVVFCDWGLTNDQLIIVTRSNSWMSNSPVYRKPATIHKLTESKLLLLDRDDYDNPRERSLTKK
jgi:hypothetical protein